MMAETLTILSRILENINAIETIQMHSCDRLGDVKLLADMVEGNTNVVENVAKSVETINSIYDLKKEILSC